MRDRLELPMEYDIRRKNGYYYTGGSQRIPDAANHRGRIVRAVVAEKALQQYRGTSFEKPLLERLQENGAGAARHHFAQPRRHGSRPFPSAPAPSRFWIWKFSTPWPKPPRNAAIELTYRKPGQREIPSRASLIRIIWRTSTANGFVRLVIICAQGHPHLCSRAHPIRQADRQDLSSARKNSRWKNDCATALACIPAKGEFEVVIRFNERPPITSAKRNGTSRSKLRELKDGGVELPSL
jgi:hypothetical protein